MRTTPTRLFLPVLAVSLLASVAVAVADKPSKPARPKPPPLAEKRPVTDAYHGVQVVDDYRWLENDTDPEVRAWTAAHSEWARAQLDALPGVDAIATWMEALDDAQPVRTFPFRVGDRWYAMKALPGKKLPVLARLASLDDPASAADLFDLNTLDTDGLLSIDFMLPSFDGKKLLVSQSSKGSEAGTIYIYDLATGKPLADVIPGVNNGTAGGSAAWLPDSSGFYYTRYPRKGERPEAELGFWQQLWLHKLGSAPEKDSVGLGKELPKIAENKVYSSPDGKYLACKVLNGDGGEMAIHVLKAGKWVRVAANEDKIVDLGFGSDGSIYLLSLAGAPKGKILRLAPGLTELAKATVVVPEGEGRLQEFAVAKSRVYVSSLVGGPSVLRSYGLDGSGGEIVPTPPVSSVFALNAIGEKAGDDLLYAVSSFLEPYSLYRFAPGGQPVKSTFSMKATIDFSGYEVERVMATSKDGTQVPINLLHKKGIKRNGKNPVILTGYGGYGISQTPRFWESISLFLDQGGVLASANLRGGAEFGETWHEQGMLTRKQNVFDDFIACAEWLVKNKVTSSKKLAIWGGSNGGLLMGAVVTQRPELFAAVVSSVGIYDMLRVELSTNGEFNVTEFGTVKNQEQFKALHAYSPYHHVKDGVKYPPILLVTGDNDPRVLPMQSRKFAARLEAAGAKDVLLYTNANAGHGVPDRKQRFRQGAYSMAFTMKKLGMTYKPVKPPRVANK